jgi:hypothetical protein
VSVVRNNEPAGWLFLAPFGSFPWTQWTLLEPLRASYFCIHVRVRGSAAICSCRFCVLSLFLSPSLHTGMGLSQLSQKMRVTHPYHLPSHAACPEGTGWLQQA